MKRLLLALTVPLMALTVIAEPSEVKADGYPPVLWGNYGWWRAIHNRESICVADIPYLDDYEVLAPWNAIAGWYLFYPWDQCWWWGTTPSGTVPHIDFVYQSPISGGYQAYAQTHFHWNYTISHGTIFYDPHKNIPGSSHGRNALGNNGWSPQTAAHEIGHLLGFDHGNPDGYACDNDYLGVMSYCNFYGGGPWWYWWQADDQWILWNVGYRS